MRVFSGVACSLLARRRVGVDDDPSRRRVHLQHRVCNSGNEELARRTADDPDVVGARCQNVDDDAESITARRDRIDPKQVTRVELARLDRRQTGTHRDERASDECAGRVAVRNSVELDSRSRTMWRDKGYRRGKANARSAH